MLKCENKKYLGGAKLILILLLLLLVIWGTSKPKDVTIYTHESFENFENGWLQIIDGKEYPLNSIKNPISTADDSSITITRTITEEMQNKCLLFFAEHQEVFVEFESEIIQSFVCEEIFSIFKTPGRSWVKIPISDDMLGKELTLTFNSAFKSYDGLPSKFYCVAENSIYAVQTEFLSLRNTLALLMLMLALASYVNALIWKLKRTKKFLFSLADLYLFIGLWLCAETNVMAIWFGRSAISSIFAMIIVRIVPVGLYHFFMSILPYRSIRSKIAGILVWSNLLISLLLQFVFGIPLLYLSNFNLLAIVSVCLLGLVEIGYYHGSRVQFLSFSKACYWSSLLFIGTLIECYVYVRYKSIGSCMGLAISFTGVIYYIITHIYLVSAQSVIAKEKLQLEQAFCDIHKSPLNQQINAHFLYNSLNTISAFCKENSDKAYEAIRLLGQYMRAYTKLLGANDYVSLEEELDLMQTYMAIQNMRFENTIEFQVRNTCDDDVLLPPLSLQPLVENAVNHGIRKKEGGGIISIKTCYKFGMAEIVVQDDGAGFDENSPKTSTGVGIKNLQKRIKAMGGSLSIESTIGKGTKVILIVPIEQEGKELDSFIC